MHCKHQLIGVLVGAVLLGACTATTKHAQTDLKYPVSGPLYTIVPVGMKDFETKGLIFVTSKVTYDINGDRTGSEITHEMLLREAAKVGADDVINVKIDQRDITATDDLYEASGMSGASRFTKRTHYPRETVYTASALAIKYTKTILPPELKNPHAAPAPAMADTALTEHAATVLPVVQTNPDTLSVPAPKSATKQFNKRSVFSKAKKGK